MTGTHTVHIHRGGIQKVFKHTDRKDGQSGWQTTPDTTQTQTGAHTDTLSCSRHTGTETMCTNIHVVTHIHTHTHTHAMACTYG